MSKRDYYEVLSVARDASDKEIKKAYRRMAMKCHPDRNPGDKQAEKTFKELNEAFEILSDQNKRALYDQHGHAGVNQNARGGAGDFSDIGDVFGDVFGDIFGGGRSGGHGGSGAGRGSDLRFAVELDLEEAVKGCTKTIRIPSMATCDSCHGTGAQKGSSPVTCTTCGGHGQVRMQQGFFTVQQTCPDCRGSGKMINNPCRDCHGQGRVRKNKTLSVKIPSGCGLGDRIRLSNEGEAGTGGGPSGDLYVEIKVREHHIFERDGKNLYCEIPISIVDATLGGEMEVPTLNGKVKLKIPAETQTGKMFRMRGKGVSSARTSGVGDLICRVLVEVPVGLTVKQREILRELQESLENDKQDHSPQKTNFFNGVKNFVNNLKS